MSRATLEPNVGPPGNQRLEGMEPDPEEELINSLGQILARIEEVGRAQAEESRLFLKAVLDPPERRLNPCLEPPTSEPSELRTSEDQEPSEPPALLTTPVPRDPSAEGRPWFPSQLPVPQSPNVPGSVPQSPLLLSPAPVPQSPHVLRPVPQSPLLLGPVPQSPLLPRPVTLLPVPWQYFDYNRRCGSSSRHLPAVPEVMPRHLRWYPEVLPRAAAAANGPCPLSRQV
ncbi:hypothetical protein EYF80_037733 [Liparis tanakae]|uniref:Uncharacterized protein n=1 Tax=Liparis tanakae TaxID=230148 RepID=A0A4Z2GGQ7_9TELE|nr:hypothetical protein EYF80_037733 [Liparis tanakae]